MNIKRDAANLLLTGFLTLMAASTPAQNAAYCNATDCLFWAEQPEEIDSTVVTYAQNVWSIDEWDNALGCAFFNQCENLKMLVYSPKLQPGEKRPLVVLIHGGGFISGDYTAFQATAKSLAQLGYVTATINYRLCKRNNCLVIAATGCANLCNGNFNTDFATSAYVAALDANNAIRYLQQNAAQFHIDPENIIVGGHSAGAWTAMNVAFMDQTEANGLNSGWQSSWGALNPVSGIKGVICMSGAVVDTNFIDANETTPVFVLHGTCDPTVCYDYDAAFHCNSSYPKVFGGRRIAERLRNLGHPYYLFSGLGMGHDIAPLQSIWGDEVIRYMRTAMLCGNFIQKHAAIALNPGSAECALLEFDIPGCLLQHNHAQLPPSAIPVSTYWGGFPAPCGTGLVGAEELAKKPLVSVYPTLVDEVLTIETGEDMGRMTIDLWNAQGQYLRQMEYDGGSTERLEMSGYPPGMYLLQWRAPGGETGTLRVVKILR